MEQKLVQISKVEYQRLKEAAEIDWELVAKFKQALNDVKHGRIREITPKNYS